MAFGVKAQSVIMGRHKRLWSVWMLRFLTSTGSRRKREGTWTLRWLSPFDIFIQSRTPALGIATHFQNCSYSHSPSPVGPLWKSTLVQIAISESIWIHIN